MGPNDRTDEVVAPPQQLSGVPRGCQRGSCQFVMDGDRPKRQRGISAEVTTILCPGLNRSPCLTYFLKAVYTVQDYGVQPLHYLEVACVPNGLPMFDGTMYARTFVCRFPARTIRAKPKRTGERASASIRWHHWKVAGAVARLDFRKNSWQTQPRDPVRRPRKNRDFPIRASCAVCRETSCLSGVFQRF